MSRHRDGGPDVRLKLGAMLLAIALLFGALCASGIAMVTGFRGAETPRPRMAPRFGNAPPAVQYTGPLPTEMVGLVTIGADPTGTRPPIASPVALTSSSMMPSSSVPARSPITVVVAVPRSTSAAPTSTSKSTTPTSSAPPTPSFPWPTTTYSWPGQGRG